MPGGNEDRYQWEAKGNTAKLWRKDGTYAIAGRRDGNQPVELTEVQIDFREDGTTPVIGEHMRFQNGKAKSVVNCELNPDAERVEADTKKKGKRLEKPTPGKKSPDYQIADCMTVTDELCKLLEEGRLHDPNGGDDEDGTEKFKDIAPVCIDLLVAVDAINHQGDVFEKVNKTLVSKTQKDGFAAIQKLYGENISEGVAQVKYQETKTRPESLLEAGGALVTLVNAAEMCGRMDRFNRPAAPAQKRLGPSQGDGSKTSI